ncbi:hypothetical protein [Vibrio cincinnatiensis]|uniref:hypothetical protein n=1 Tax=Vibrio cincinnatiensis TaxID=675 RepID=UPI001EDF243F|nr:hypothetical protein [Vibrio cincinnatiensis]MCG3729641.1 hypothetical protein [Vibrio cincinnatiensis]
MLSAKSSLTEARKRLGVEPVPWLFHQSASHWSGQVEVGKWEGLRVYAIDGTQFRVELGYREIKCTMLRKAIALRSKKITLVYQELYGLLLAYNLIRYEMALAAKEAKVSPLRISFKLGFKVVLYDYTAICQTRNLQSIPARLKDLTDDLKDLTLPKPDRPNYERSVKIRPNKYPLKSSRKKKEYS